MAAAVQTYSITVERRFDVAGERLWQALTQPRDLDGWFSGKSTFDLKVGGRFRNEDGDNWLVTALTPGKSIDFTWENGNEYHGSHLRIEVETAGGGTTLRFVQSDIAKLESAQSQLEGWSWALHTLDSYLRTGKRVRYGEWEAAGKP